MKAKFLALAIVFGLMSVPVRADFVSIDHGHTAGDRLLVIDPNTGHGTRVGPSILKSGSVQGLAFDSSNNLFGNFLTGSTAKVD